MRIEITGPKTHGPIHEVLLIRIVGEGQAVHDPTDPEQKAEQ